MTLSTKIDFAKNAQIEATTRYPIVSAYEFEFLKGDKEVREHLKGSTVYMIVQRPLTYFDNVTIEDGIVAFEIADGTQPPLKCSVSLVDTDICPDYDGASVQVQFYGAQQVAPPFREVAGLKVRDKAGEFLVWWSPFKFLYEVLVRGLPAEIDGDPLKFLDFEIHYIGQAFKQRVWNRLTGHEKMQKVLTLEGPIGASPQARAPFEIALIMLDVVGLTELVQMGAPIMSSGAKPIRTAIDIDDDKAFEAFNRPSIKIGDKAMTNELEASLINRFKPKHNDTLFERYPYLSKGMRSKGYSETNVVIENLPASLKTATASMNPIVIGPFAPSGADA